ncbi:MAG: response regulator [bacterium]
MTIKTKQSKKPESDEQAAELTPCDKNRILVVDDEKVILDLFWRLLSLRLPKCRIDIAVNGAEAVEQFRAAHHSVIMMDLRMPVMDGQQAFLEIQSLCREENVEMPSVVFCTGYDPPGMIQRLVAGNTKHCILHKPVPDNILLETLTMRLGA